MTTDLMMLTWSAVLCALLFVPYGIAQTLGWGVVVSVGTILCAVALGDMPPIRVRRLCSVRDGKSRTGKR